MNIYKPAFCLIFRSRTSLPVASYPRIPNDHSQNGLEGFMWKSNLVVDSVFEKIISIYRRDIYHAKNNVSMQMDHRHPDMAVTACKSRLCHLEVAHSMRYFPLLSHSYQIHSLVALAICKRLVNDDSIFKISH